MTEPILYIPRRSSLYVMAGALIIGLLSLIASTYFFTGFLGGERSAMGVFQAFCLCFGIGAVLYLPAAIVFFMARHVRAYGPKLSIGLAATLISLPLWSYGGAALFMRTPYWSYGLLAMLLGLGLLFWALGILRGVKAS